MKIGFKKRIYPFKLFNHKGNAVYRFIIIKDSTDIDKKCWRYLFFVLNDGVIIENQKQIK